MYLVRTGVKDGVQKTQRNERPESTGVSKVFPGKRRLKLSQGENLNFRWTQFGIQSLRGCLFQMFGSTLVAKIEKRRNPLRSY